MGIGTARPTQWFRHNKGALPSLLALLGVAAFWVVAIIGGLHYLAGVTSPMVMLTGLYMALAAVAVSIIVATLALNDLAHRRSRR